jgi:hypothetical protein
MGVGKDLWTEFETRYNEGGTSAVASLYASDVVYADPTGGYEGREAIVAYVEPLDGAFPDASIETSRLIEEGETVVAEYT